jgi:hypothetical protein
MTAFELVIDALVRVRFLVRDRARRDQCAGRMNDLSRTTPDRFGCNGLTKNTNRSTQSFIPMS